MSSMFRFIGTHMELKVAPSKLAYFLAVSLIRSIKSHHRLMHVSFGAQLGTQEFPVHPCDVGMDCFGHWLCIVRALVQFPESPAHPFCLPWPGLFQKLQLYLWESVR